MLRYGLAAFIILSGLIEVAPASASSYEPTWMGVVVARGDLKAQIEATPILERQNRPFHFYGNTVRREYYRGTRMPAPRDLIKASTALIFKR